MFGINTEKEKEEFATGILFISLFLTIPIVISVYMVPFNIKHFCISYAAASFIGYISTLFTKYASDSHRNYTVFTFTFLSLGALACWSVIGIVYVITLFFGGLSKFHSYVNERITSPKPEIIKESLGTIWYRKQKLMKEQAAPIQASESPGSYRESPTTCKNCKQLIG
jgi:hypothetical protein